MAVGLPQILDLVRKKNEISRWRLDPRPAQEQDTEFEPPVNIGEYKLAVLEIVKCDQRLFLHQIIEEMLRRVIGGDATWNKQSHAALRRDYFPGQFCEQHVGVHVASPREWVISAGADAREHLFSGGFRGLVALPQFRILRLDLRNELPAVGRVDGGGDFHRAK